MKAAALLLAVLAIGDMAFDHGDGMRAVLTAAAIFGEHFRTALHDSIFAG